ncbi:hypothetical protein KSP39_PZI009210 [Platanthera zijinensis]|uniref:Uncharacterized protein n=1 Tax=Platanthera zijinensis TaxID=2320716 RepID=A0AAP0G7X4_9ASPA
MYISCICMFWMCHHGFVYFYFWKFFNYLKNKVNSPWIVVFRRDSVSVWCSRCCGHERGDSVMNAVIMNRCWLILKWMVEADPSCKPPVPGQHLYFIGLRLCLGPTIPTIQSILGPQL